MIESLEKIIETCTSCLGQHTNWQVKVSFNLTYNSLSHYNSVIGNSNCDARGTSSAAAVVGSFVSRIRFPSVSTSVV